MTSPYYDILNTSKTKVLERINEYFNAHIEADTSPDPAQAKSTLNRDISDIFDEEYRRGLSKYIDKMAEFFEDSKE